MLKRANKKTNNFNIYNVFFFKEKTKTKNTCRYHYQNLDDMIYSSWDIEQSKLKFVIRSFFALYPPKTPKNMLEISSFYTCAPKTTTIWCKVTGIWGETQNFLSFYIHVYHKWRSYDIQLLRCDRKKFSTFCAIFCPFSPLTAWKIKILTVKKTPEDIIILQT